MRNLSAYNRRDIVDWARADAKRQGGGLPTSVFGIYDDTARVLMEGGHDFIYFDHSYFKRGWHNGNFRAVRGDVHLTKLLNRPDDRLKRWGVQIEPWRKTGSEIVVIPPSERQQAIYNNSTWLMDTLERLSHITDRPVTTKHGKFSSLREFCANAWAVVTYASVAGVEAAFMGIPVFPTERCPSRPVSAGPLEAIETPEYSEARHALACSLSYASWNAEEMRNVKWVDYQYEILQ